MRRNSQARSHGPVRAQPGKCFLVAVSLLALPLTRGQAATYTEDFSQADGPPADWVVVIPTVAVESEELTLTPSAIWEDVVSYAGQSGAGLYFEELTHIEFDITFPGEPVSWPYDHGGIIFCAQNTATRYGTTSYVVDYLASRFRLSKFIDGAETLLGQTDANITAYEGRWEIDLTATTITLTVNGQEQFSFTNTDVPRSGYVGFWAYREPAANKVAVDNVRIDYAPATEPTAGHYLVWADEFNGGSLDTTKWNIETGPRRDAVNSAAAVSVTGGSLVITTHTVGGTHYTGLIQTAGKFHPRYGYTEAAIRWEDSPGMWSAFWMWISTMFNEGDVAVHGAEIDVCEHRKQDGGGANINDQIVANVYWDGYGPGGWSGSGLMGSGLGSGYHRYGLQWDSSQYRVFLDGTPRWSTLEGVSQRSEYLIFSSEVEDHSWAGDIPAGGYGSLATSTTKLFVDYVRFYAPTTTVYWTGASSADWRALGNWTAGMTPKPGDEVVFSLLTQGNRATTLGQDFSLHGLAFMESGGAISVLGNTLTLGAGGIDVASAEHDPTITSAIQLGTAQTWKTRSGRVLTVSGPIGGAADLTLAGYGEVRLTGDSSLSGTVTVAPDATLAGTGSLAGSLVLQGQLSPGNSVGRFTAGPATLEGGGTLVWEISHPVNGSGWDALNVNGVLNVTADSGTRFVVKPVTLTAGGAPGLLAGFDNQSGYTWTIATASGGVTGFAPEAFAVDTNGVANALAGGVFTVGASAGSLLLKFHANVPPQFTSGTLSGGVFELRATGVPGKGYTVQTATNLLPPPLPWSPLTNLAAGTEGLLQFEDSALTGGLPRFYRVIAE